MGDMGANDRQQVANPIGYGKQRQRQIGVEGSEITQDACLKR
jgi:hypothetical protein